MRKINKYRKKWFEFTGYEPHPGQQKLHNIPKGVRFSVCCCGRRWGKSFSAAREAEIVATQQNKLVWIVAPTYGTSERIFRILWDNLIIKHQLPTRRKSLAEQYIEFEWGSIIEGKSAEHAEGLIGAGCDLVIMDECSKMNLKKIWQMYIRPTLSDRKGNAIFISTPSGYDYFYELYNMAKRHKEWRSFNSPSWENTYAFPLGKDEPDLIEAASTLSTEAFSQEYGAQFTSMSGRVYADFSRDENVGYYPYMPLYPVYLSLDFGYRMPAAVWFQCYRQEKGKGEDWHINIIDELVHVPNLKLSDFIRMIKNKKYRIQQVFGDPAGYQVQSSVGVGESELFHQATGHRVWSLRDKPSRSIASGVSHVRSFIKTADGKRRLHIHNNCTGIIEDLESYRYPERNDGRPLPENPLKDGYSEHGADALRYGLINKFPIRQYKYRIANR